MSMIPPTPEGKRLAPLIDHTLLRAEATSEQVAALCREAIYYGFAAVCVNPRLLPVAVRETEGFAVKAGTVVGFPLGADPADQKAAEAARAVERGAEELDMVMAIGDLKEKNYRAVQEFPARYPMWNILRFRTIVFERKTTAPGTP